MASLRTPTTWFLLLTLLPAAILAWQGWQATAPLLHELERQTRASLERHGEAVAAALPGQVAELSARHHADLVPLAEQLQRELPDGGGEPTLREHPLALIVAGPREPIWPSGPASWRLQRLPEWPRFAAWRQNLPTPPSLAVATALSFTTPSLRALALTHCWLDQPDRAAAALAEFAWRDLAAAGPLPCELLMRSAAGRVQLARGLADGALYRVPGTESARARWLRAAGAGQAESNRQDLRAAAERGELVLTARTPIAGGATLTCLVPLDLEQLAAPWQSPEFAVALSLGSGDAAASDEDGELTLTRTTAVGPITIHTQSLTRAELLRGAVVQRWLTGLGLVLLVALLATGLWLVRRALLREQAARALRDDFIANVSHELKTPLTSLRLHAEMLAGELDAAARRDYGAVAVAEGARLSALVDDLLDFAALERGQRRLEPEPVDLAAALQSLANTWRPLLAREQVALRVHSSADACALADPTALMRVLTNLLQNALRHGQPTRDGAPRVIELRAADGQVEVRDNGPGVPPSQRTRIFERFARVHRNRPGVGLGLALSRELARAQRGELTCDDDGTCTVFRLTLPTLTAETEP